MTHSALPRMMTLRQRFSAGPRLDVRVAVESGFASVRSRLKPGMRVAVAVGSRQREQRGENEEAAGIHRDVPPFSLIRTKLTRMVSMSCLPCASRVLNSHSSMRAGSGSVSIS